LSGILHPLGPTRITLAGIHGVYAAHRQIDLPRPPVITDTHPPEWGGSPPVCSTVDADPAPRVVACAFDRDAVVTVVSRDLHDEARTTVVFH